MRKLSATSLRVTIDRVLAVVIVACVLTFAPRPAFAADAEASADAAAATSTRIMPLGDSMTAGYISDNNPDNEAGGYRRYLWERLATVGITNVDFVGSLQSGVSTMDRDHEGHPGFRIDELTGPVGGWLATSQPDVILLLIGQNDLIQGATPQTALGRLATLLDTIHDLRPGARVLVATLPGVMAGNTFGVAPQAVVDFNGGIPGLVSDRAALGWNIGLVDLFVQAGLDRASGSVDYGSDGLHPSPIGYAKLAGVWFAALDPIVAPATAPPGSPTQLTAAPVSPSEIDLAWNAPSQGSPVVSAGDQFDRADGDLGTDWMAMNGAFDIVGGHVQPALTDTFTLARYLAWPGGEDQWAEAAITVDGAGSGCGPVVRLNSAGTALYFVDYNGRNDHGLFRTSNGSTERIGGWTAPAHVGDVVRLEAVGSTIRVRVNGVLVLVVENGDVTGGAPGVYAYNGSAQAGHTILDSFAASSVPAAPVAGYRIYRNGPAVATTAAAGYRDGGLAASTTYSYAVTAYGGPNLESRPSNVASAATLGFVDTTPPDVPTGLVAVPASASRINLSWNAVSDGTGSTGVNDDFARADGGLGGGWVGLNGAFKIASQQAEPAAANTYTTAAVALWTGGSDQYAEVRVTVTGAQSGTGPIVRLSNGGNNQYFVDYNGRASHGLFRMLSGSSVQIGGWTDAAAPGDVVRLEAVGTTIRVLVNGVVKVSVEDAQVTGGVPGLYAYNSTTPTLGQVILDDFAAAGLGAVAGYRVYRDGVAVGTTTATSYQDTGLGANTTHTYNVTAYDTANNESAQSSPASATTLAAGSDTTAPTAPTGLTASAGSASQIDLSWTVSTDDVAVTGYRVYRNGTTLATTATTAYQDAELTASTAYTYRVTAFDAAGNESPQSGAASATTLAAVDTTAPSVPTRLDATAVSATQVDLSWDAAVDETSGTAVGDTFDRGNGGLGVGWNALSSTFTIVSQHAEPLATDTYTTAQLAGWTGGGDQSAEVRVTVTGLNSGGGPVVRVSNSGNILYLVDYNGRGDHGLYRALNGPLVRIGSWSEPASPGDILRLEAIGSTIRVLVNGVVKVSVQNAEVTGGVPGLYAYNGSTPAGQVILDDFAAAALAPVAGYRVYRDGAAIGTTVGTSYNDPGRTANTAYTYRVAAYDSATNESAQSSPASATTLAAGGDTTAPTIPTGLTASAGSASQINLSWTGSTDDVAVTGYRIFRNGTAVGTTATTSYQDAGLTASTAYTYRVSAFDAAGHESAQSGPASATTLAAVDTTAPSVPTGLAASAASSTQINLSWAASTDNVAVTGYRIYRNGIAVATTGTTNYQDTGLTPSTAYGYRVTAFDAAANQSGQSAIATATTSPDTTAPSKPNAVKASAVSATQITVSWNASVDNVGVAGYRVFRNGSAVATVTAATYQDTGRSPSTTYSYTVTAFDAAGNESAQSKAAGATTASDTTPPTVPTGVTASAVSSSQISLSWSPSSDNVAVTGYRVFRNGTAVGTAAGTTFQDTGLTANTFYSYRVAAFDTAGNQSAQSAAASATTTAATTDTTPPTVPTGLSASAVSTTQVNLSWAASTDTVGVTGYRVYRNGTAVGTTSVTSFQDSGLTASTTYTYRVTAFDAAVNESVQSGPATATTLAASTDTTAPTIPTGLTASVVSSSQVDVSWNAATDNVGVTGYRIYRNGVAIATTTGRTFQNTGLKANTAYSYAVTAFDAVGNESAQSGTVSVRTAKR